MRIASDEPEEPLMIVGEEGMTLSRAFREVSGLLVGLVLPLTPTGPIAVTYDYEPGTDHMEDLYVAMTCQATGFGRVPGRFDEVQLPNLLRFALRWYYPIYDDDPELDGLKVAQEKTLDGMSFWEERLRADVPAGYRSLGQRVRQTDAEEGRTTVTSEAGQPLYAWEVDASVRLH